MITIRPRITSESAIVTITTVSSGWPSILRMISSWISRPITAATSRAKSIAGPSGRLNVTSAVTVT